MAISAAELRKSIQAALEPDITASLRGVYVLGSTPVNAAFPHVSIASTTIYDWIAGLESETEQLLTLHVWSKERSSNEVQELMQGLADRMSDAGLALEHHVGLRLEFSEISFDEDLLVHHGLLRFRATIGIA